MRRSTPTYVERNVYIPFSLANTSDLKRISRIEGYAILRVMYVQINDTASGMVELLRVNKSCSPFVRSAEGRNPRSKIKKPLHTLDPTLKHSGSGCVG